MAQLIQYIIMVSVILLMLGAGLRISFKQVVDVVKRFQLIARGLIANFVIIPLIFFLCVRWLPISIDVKIGIMLMAAAPMAPMVSMFVDMAKGDLVYSIGLLTIVSVLSVPLTPLILSLTLPSAGGELVLDPLQIVKTILFVQLIPVTVGMVVRQISPTLTDKLIKIIPRIGQIGLIVGVGLLMASQAKQILTINFPSHLVFLGLVIVSLFIGYLMMLGDTASRQRSLAVSTAIRNIPLAFLIANASYQGTPVAPVTLVFSIYTMVFSIVYGKLIVGRKGNST
jgi:BASS family bile acid:Na+ symporter